MVLCRAIKGTTFSFLDVTLLSYVFFEWKWCYIARQLPQRAVEEPMFVCVCITNESNIVQFPDVQFKVSLSNDLQRYNYVMTLLVNAY